MAAILNNLSQTSFKFQREIQRMRQIKFQRIKCLQISKYSQNIYKSHQISSRINTKEKSDLGKFLAYHTVQYTKNHILKTAAEDTVYRGTKIHMLFNILSEALKIRREWNCIFKLLKKN